jgi:hypothetical protein
MAVPAAGMAASRALNAGRPVPSTWMVAGTEIRSQASTSRVPTPMVAQPVRRHHATAARTGGHWWTVRSISLTARTSSR